MLVQQVRTAEGSFTNVQVSIGNEGGKPVFEPYGKVGQRLQLANGTIVGVEDIPIMGADKKAYFKVVKTYEIASPDQTTWKPKALPDTWPKAAYVKGADLTKELVQSF